MLLIATLKSPDAFISCLLLALITGMSLEDVANAHWKEYGRNYYARYDYEGVDKAKAEERKCNTIWFRWIEGL